jgi:anaerobic selenocysteine-containing dehydrogenase
LTVSTIRHGPSPKRANAYVAGPALTGRLRLDLPINVLFVYNRNPVISAPEESFIVEGLAREDLFTIVSEQFLTDTALYADIGLPAATQLEQVDLMFSWGHFYLTWNERAIAPWARRCPTPNCFAGWRKKCNTTLGFDAVMRK